MVRVQTADSLSAASRASPTCSIVATCFEISGLGIEREIVIDNLLVRIHLIIEMILVDRPCAMGV